MQIFSETAFGLLSLAVFTAQALPAPDKPSHGVVGVVAAGLERVSGPQKLRATGNAHVLERTVNKHSTTGASNSRPTGDSGQPSGVASGGPNAPHTSQENTKASQQSASHSTFQHSVPHSTAQHSGTASQHRTISGSGTSRGHPSETHKPTNTTGATSAHTGGCTPAISGPLTGAASAVKTSSFCGPVPTGWTQIPDPKGNGTWINAAPKGGPCSNPYKTEASCWDSLHLGGFITWWWDSNKGECNKRGLGFGDCFYSLETPYEPSTCRNIGTNPECKEPSYGSYFAGSWMGPTRFYVAYNIWNLNSFFSTYWSAVNDASLIAYENLGNIVEIVDPKKKANVVLNDIMTAFSVGLSVFPGLEEYKPLQTTIMNAASQAPGVVKFLYPEGTLGSQSVTFDAVSKRLGDVTSELQKQIASSAQDIINDSQTLVSFANTGAFTGKLPTLQNLADGLTQSFLTYIISQGYQQNGIFLSRAVDTDVNMLEHNGTKLFIDPGCHGGYSHEGTCGPFWYDSSARITYGLVNGQDEYHDFTHEMHQLLGNLTHGNWLFAGAEDCSGGKKPGKPVIKQGKVTIPCLSSLKICTWNQKPGNAVTIRDNLFSDCKTSMIPGEDDNTAECSARNDGGLNPIALPPSYLGWLVSRKNVKESYTVCQK